MEAENFTLEHEVRFLTNNGDFNEQPVFTITNSKALTGTNFISLMRVAGRDANESTAGDHKHESLSGFMKIVVGSSAGIWSVSADNGINANYLYGVSATPEFIGMTAESNLYSTNLNLVGRDKIVLYTKADNLFSHQISTTGFASFSGASTNMNVLGTGIRPDAEAGTSPDGTTGKSLVLQYYFNRMELESESFVTSGLTGIKDRSGNGISAAVYGQGVGSIASVDLTDSASSNNIATVTGWTYGVCEGGFKFKGGTYIESDSSSLFNVNGVASSSMSFVSFMKLSSTSDQVLVAVGSGTTEVFKVAVVSGQTTENRTRTGVLKFFIGDHSFTGVATGLEIGKFHHIGLTMDGGTNSSASGVSAYHNGTCIATTAVNSFPNLQTNGRLIFGRGLDRAAASSMTGVIGLTRIFNRSLSSTEIALNYFSALPAMQDVNSLRVAQT